MSERKKIAILTGAGISRESGILTFRDCEDGLWNNYKIDEVCTTQAWKNNREGVLEFYNARRKDLEGKVPNDGHKALVELEEFADVIIVTQNVDDLHEQAGSTRVIHLHGELTKVRSSMNPKSEPIDIGYDEINVGDKHEDGSQLRPHIVFFGDDVPEMQRAQIKVYDADVLIVVGTSLNVYPAAGLVGQAIQWGKEVYLVDPGKPEVSDEMMEKITFIQEPATTGCKALLNTLKLKSISDNLKGKELFPEKNERAEDFFDKLDENEEEA